MRSWLPALAALLIAAASPRAATLQELAPRHAQFLDEAEWILTPEEQSAFLSLDSDARRDQFVELFWKQRDPTPATAENEFREEHERRIRYADEFYGKGSRQRGSKTQRGRICILLGKPLSVQHEDGGQTWPIEMWFYQGLNLRGLPTSMYLVFYKPHEGGEWVLYSPVSDGPAALVRREQFRTADNASAFALLRSLDTELGRASLSLDATARPDPLATTPSSDNVLAGLARLPGLGVDPGYVQRFLDGKADVELETTFVYIPLHVALWTAESAGIQFLAYALQIEPRDLSLVQYENRYTARIEIDGTIEDEHGVKAADVEDHLEFSLGGDQLQSVSARPIQLQGRHVIAPGAYTLRLVLRNVTSRQYGRFEGTVRVPEPGTWGPPLLAYRTQGGGGQPMEEERPFDSGGLRALPWTDARVSMGAPVVVVARTPADVKSVKLTLDGPKGAQSWTAEPHDGLLAFPIPREALAVGEQQLALSAVHGGNKQAGAPEALHFTVAPAAWAEPWIASGRLTPAASNEVLLQEAELLEKTGRAGLAIERVRKRFDATGKTDAALGFALASLCLKSRRFAEAQALADPQTAALRWRKPVQGEDLWFRILAFAQAGQNRPADAALTLGEALERTVPTPELLNQQARWFRDAGQIESARQAYRRSLAIEKDQPQVQKDLDALR
jgi:GWxTD domain-containing protein